MESVILLNREANMRMLSALALVVFVLWSGAASATQRPAGATRGTAGSDPAVDAYTSFVDGKELEVPVDRDFVVAGLDRLASAAEALTLTRRTPNAAVLNAAHRIRREIRRLRQLDSDAPEITKQRWNVFVSTARLIADVSRDLGKSGASDGVLDALITAADGLDYDYPLKWQPNAIHMYFDLAARALRQMKP
jgi:hypothetical protein